MYVIQQTSIAVVYRMEGNISGNYIVQFHVKIIGFLLAELIFLF